MEYLLFLKVIQIFRCGADATVVITLHKVIESLQKEASGSLEAICALSVPVKHS